MAIGERSDVGLVALEVVAVEPNEEQDIAINLPPPMVEGLVLGQVLNREVVIPTGVEVCVCVCLCVCVFVCVCVCVCLSV